MIVTVTPNPSMDRTIAIAKLEPGMVARATSIREEPGGKGLKVSECLALHGVHTTAVLPLGGGAGQAVWNGLAGTTVDVVPVHIHGVTRFNTALVEPDGRTTKINEPGPHLNPGEGVALLDAVRAAVNPGTRWIVGSGSLPRGLPVDWYVGLIALARDLGVRVAIDTSGPALTAAVAAKPDLIKPSRDELSELVGRRLTTPREILKAARAVQRSGVDAVLVSTGEDGALLVRRRSALRAIAPVEVPASDVGAGSALLAGYLLAESRRRYPREWLRSGVAFGAAAIRKHGSAMPGPADVSNVVAVVLASDDHAAPVLTAPPSARQATDAEVAVDAVWTPPEDPLNPDDFAAPTPLTAALDPQDVDAAAGVADASLGDASPAEPLVVTDPFRPLPMPEPGPED